MPIFDRSLEREQAERLARLRQFMPPPPSEPPTPPAHAADPISLDALVDEAVGNLVAARSQPAPASPAATEPPPPSATSPPLAPTPLPSLPAMPPPPTPSEPRFVPRRPTGVEETGLSRAFLSEHIMRTVYFAGEITGAMVADTIGLPFPGILDGLVEALRRENLLDVKGQRGIGEAGYVLALTDRGTARANEAVQKGMYRGPAPVPLEDYARAVHAQTNRCLVVTQENIRAAFSDLLVHDSILDEVGPAVNSGSSMFLFGSPGNGKTAIAERITRLMGDNIYVPYAVEVDGAIIKLFDTVVHELVEATEGGTRLGHDRRWVEIKRPTVVVGGELTMASLDLLFNEVARFYEAPLQMKANGGMFLIDDFGRQLIRPTELLNRWIVPLEKRTDYLTLITGKKITIPFEELIVFSTNLDPADLVDDAFLRRIKFKIHVVDPDVDQFRAIFQTVARARDVPFSEDGLDYLLERHYRLAERPLRMCQPRDLLDQLIAIAKYKMLQPAMTPELLDMAARTYFVTTSTP